MKLNKYSLALILGFGVLTSCNDRLELLNPCLLYTSDAADD